MKETRTCRKNVGFATETKFYSMRNKTKQNKTNVCENSLHCVDSMACACTRDDLRSGISVFKSSKNYENGVFHWIFLKFFSIQNSNERRFLPTINCTLKYCPHLIRRVMYSKSEITVEFLKVQMKVHRFKQYKSISSRKIFRKTVEMIQ